MRARVSHRYVRLLAALGMAGVLLLPALAVPARAADDKLVLNVGLTQEAEALNPYSIITVAGYEVFQLTYNLLVDFGPNLEPVPGFADKWERAADGKSWTFHIREGMKWSDGTAGHGPGRLLLVGHQHRGQRGGRRTSGRGTSTRASATPGSRRSSAPTTRR